MTVWRELCLNLVFNLATKWPWRIHHLICKTHSGRQYCCSSLKSSSRDFPRWILFSVSSLYTLLFSLWIVIYLFICLSSIKWQSLRTETVLFISVAPIPPIKSAFNKYLWLLVWRHYVTSCWCLGNGSCLISINYQKFSLLKIALVSPFLWHLAVGTQLRLLPS